MENVVYKQEPDREVNINSESKRACTGCGVCAVSCPVKAISLELNQEGFLEASADEYICSGCGTCKRVCGKYDEAGAGTLREVLQSGADISGVSSNDRDVRMKCSSGGMGYEIAKLCLEEGYIVCGAGYDAGRDIVCHALAGNESGIEAFRGSKYIQSHTEQAFSSFEKDKKYVVFGTPCQIYTLHKYLTLQGIADKFLLVDFFCHGVPSRLLWDKYTEHLDEKYKIGKIKAVNFRDKRTGWHNYSMHIKGDKKEYVRKMEDDLFYNFFLSDVCLNKPCYDCSYRRGDMRSDIRLGDFWGAKYKDDREGVTILTANTEKGKNLMKKLQGKVMTEQATIDELLASQPQAPLAVPANRSEILEMLNSYSALSDVYRNTLMKKQIVYKVKAMIKRMIPANIRAAMKKMEG